MRDRILTHPRQHRRRLHHAPAVKLIIKHRPADAVDAQLVAEPLDAERRAALNLDFVLRAVANAGFRPK